MSFKGKWIFLKTCKRCYLLAYTIFFCTRSLSCEEHEFVFAWMNHFNSTSEQAVMNSYMLMHGEWWRRGGGVHGEWWRGEGVDFISVRVFDKVLFTLCRIGWKTSPAVVTFNVTQTTRKVSRPDFFSFSLFILCLDFLEFLNFLYSHSAILFNFFKWFI